MTPKEALEPCPFCRRSDKIGVRPIRDGRQVFCGHCGASAGPRFHGPDGDARARAIEAWNTRALSTLDSADARERIARIIAAKCFDPSSLEVGGNPIFKTSDWKVAKEAADAILGLMTVPDDFGKTYAIEHDGFVGTVQGSYVTREGKEGVNLQQVGTRVVHVYGRKWLKPVD